MPESPLRATHGWHIMHSFLAIHRRLDELESLISQPPCSSPFCQHDSDVTPPEVTVLREQFEEVRAAMLGHLRELDIPLEVRPTSVRWAVQTSLMHLQLEIEDLGPARLRRYGPLDNAGQDAALRIQDEIRRLLERSRAYLAEGPHFPEGRTSSADVSSSSEGQ